MRDSLNAALSQAMCPNPDRAVTIFKKIAPLIYAYERSLRGSDYKKELSNSDKIFLLECMALFNRNLAVYIQQLSFEAYSEFFTQFIESGDKDNDNVLYKLWIFFILDQRMRTPSAAVTIADVLTACINKATTAEAKEKIIQAFFSKQRLSTIAPYGNIFSELTLALVDAVEKDDMSSANRMSACLKLSLTCCENKDVVILLEDLLSKSVTLVAPFTTFEYVSRTIIPFERMCLAAEQQPLVMTVLFQFLSRLTKDEYSERVRAIEIAPSLNIKLAEYIILMATHNSDSISFIFEAVKSTAVIGFMIDGGIDLTASQACAPTAARALINKWIREQEQGVFAKPEEQVEAVRQSTSWAPRIFRAFQAFNAPQHEVEGLLKR